MTLSKRQPAHRISYLTIWEAIAHRSFCWEKDMLRLSKTPVPAMEIINSGNFLSRIHNLTLVPGFNIHMAYGISSAQAIEQHEAVERFF